MKKIALLLLVFLFLVGCGKTDKQLDMVEAKVAVEKRLSGMVTISDSTLTDAYGLDLNNMENWTFKQNEEGDLYAIIKTSKKTVVKNAMKEYFAKVRDFNESYSPKRLEILENRLEKELGDYLIYIVAEDSNSIYNDILDTMK